jgi:PAS domain S-box-containing protein
MAADARVLQALVDAHDLAVFAVDSDLRYLAFNAAHAEGMRALYGTEIALGGRLTDYQTVEADRQGAVQHVRRALAGERVVVSAYSGEAGRSRRFYDLVHVPLTVGDEIIGAVVRTYDVTEQRQARNGLQASEERLHRSLAAAKAGTWEWELAGNANTWSEELWELYDLERGGCEPSYDLWLQSIHPDDRHATAARVGDAAAAGDEFETEWRVNTRDGSLRWLVSRGSPVRDADGAVVRYLGVVMDITRRKEAEIALRHSQSELRALADSSPDIVFQIDRDRRLVVANAPFDQAIVTSGGEPITPGDPILPPTYPEEFRALWRAHYDRAFAGESLAVETTVPMADGAHHMENHLTPVRSDDAEVTGVVVTSRDITERRRAEQDLRDSEARFRAYFEQSLIGATVISPTMAWIDVNEAACDLLGYSREELLELTWMELTHPEDLAGDVAQFNRVLAGEIDEYRLEKRYLRKDGAVVWVDRSVRCHRGEDGNVDYLLSLLSDITGLKATEHELKQSQQRLREAHRLAHIGIWSWVAETDTVTWSEELYRIAGLDPASTAPTYAEHPTIYSTESWSRLERAVQKALTTGDSYHLELELIRPDGTSRWVNAFGGVAHDVDGRVEGLHGTVQDITERKRAEAALRESAEDFRTLADAVPQIVWTTGPDGKNTYFNQQWADYTGMTLEESHGDGWNKPFHPDDRQRAWDAWQRATTEDAPYSLECRLRRADGAYRWWLVRGEPLRDADGAIVKWFGTCTDIEEIKRGEAALRESEERHRSLFVSMAQGVVYQDAEGSIIAANPSAERILGLSLDQMQGRTSTDPRWRAIHEDGSDFPGDRHPAIVSLRTGREVSDVVMGVFNPTCGSYRWMTVNAAPQFRPGERNPFGVFTTLDDITERKQAEEELRETRDYLENLFGCANAPIIVWDAELRITRFNHAFEELTGRTAEEVVGARLELLFPEDERRAQTLALVTSASAGERWQVVEIPILRADGEVRTVLWNSATVFGADGSTPVATIAQGQDITQRTRAEAEIKRLNTDLERRVAERTRDLTAANAELEEFVYSIAHDLRSPLRSLSGFSQIIEHDYAAALDETGKDYLRRIRDAAGHLGELMDALMSLSRIGRRELDLHDVDLSALAREVAETLLEADPKRQVDFEIEEGLIAKGDTALCEIVVQNLIGNAWKFSAGETPALIRFGAERRDGRRVFCVADNGVGFDPEYAGRLFAPFERLHTADEFPGTGIGLATVRRAVTRLGGDCWADAEHGDGARLYFTLEEPV